MITLTSKDSEYSDDSPERTEALLKKLGQPRTLSNLHRAFAAVRFAERLERLQGSGPITPLKLKGN